jgi:hypothetical protein
MFLSILIFKKGWERTLFQVPFDITIRVDENNLLIVTANCVTDAKVTTTLQVETNDVKFYLN